MAKARKPTRKAKPAAKKAKRPAKAAAPARGAAKAKGKGKGKTASKRGLFASAAAWVKSKVASVKKRGGKNELFHSRPP